MSWKQTAQPSPNRVERRRAPRFMGKLQLKILTMRGPMDATLIDISYTGCRVHSQHSAMLLKNSQIRFMNSNFAIHAEMVWRHGQASGWRFLYSPNQAVAIQTEIKSLSRRLTVI